MIKWMPILHIWLKVTSRDENAGNTARFCDKAASRREVCAVLDWFRYKPSFKPHTYPLNLKQNGKYEENSGDTCAPTTTTRKS